MTQTAAADRLSENNCAGRRFGRWTVIRYAGRSKSKNALFACICDCGNEKVVRGTSLLMGNRRGGSLSCGCLAVDKATKHGMTPLGATPPQAYRCWAGIKNRCFNKKNPCWKHYGGRGITVCGRWASSFVAFLEDVGLPPTERHTIERVDVNGNYEPGNVRWATMKEQQRNRRNNHLLTYEGVSQCMSAWAEQLAMTPGQLRNRLRLGWTVADALTIPIDKVRQERSRGACH